MFFIYKCTCSGDCPATTLHDVGSDLELLMKELYTCRDLSATYYFYRARNLVHPFMIIQPLED